MSADPFFDAAGRERELQAESALWDTDSPVPAGPGDVPTVDVEPYFTTGSPEDLERSASQLRAASSQVGFHQLVGCGLV
ncbi:MAG: hypothetical protein ACR2P0_11120, partial [Acidimicrobiales bacterium]